MSNFLKIDWDKTNIKKLNDFNQITKRIFNGFYLFNDGIIINDMNNSKLSIGRHFATTLIEPIDDIPNNCIYLTTDKIYKTIRDNKKNIKHLLVNNNKIYIGNDEVKEKIGYVIKNIPLNQKDPLLSFIEYHKKSSSMLPQNIIDLLCDNGIYTYSEDIYKVRLTKELLPALKKNMKVIISFKQDENSSLFYLLLSIDRGALISYHVYKCVKF